MNSYKVIKQHQHTGDNRPVTYRRQSPCKTFLLYVPFQASNTLEWVTAWCAFEIHSLRKQYYTILLIKSTSLQTESRESPFRWWSNSLGILCLYWAKVVRTFCLLRSTAIILGDWSAAMLTECTQQTRDAGPMLVWCWANVVDGGPTSNQHWPSVSCLLGRGARVPSQPTSVEMLQKHSPYRFEPSPVTRIVI